jgi:hypothetical protein
MMHGVMNKDTVWFNGLRIPGQTINEIVREQSGGGVLADASFQGIVGLAYPAIAEPGDVPILDNIKS